MENGDYKILEIETDCSKCKKNQTANQKVPVSRIIEKLDLCFKSNNLTEAEKLLTYWQQEAKSLGDFSGELSVVNEWLGLSRKIQNKQKGESSVARALELVEKLNLQNSLSGATVLLNAATTCKSFGFAEKGVLLYKQVETVYNKNLKPNDLLFAAFYNNYATALVDVKNYALAETLYKKAINITAENSSLPDCAVSYVNIAHLYEKSEGPLSENINKSLEKAAEILNSNAVEHNSYYAFVCEKCAPSFEYFGFFVLAAELNKRSKEIYARS